MAVARGLQQLSNTTCELRCSLDQVCPTIYSKVDVLWADAEDQYDNKATSTNYSSNFLQTAQVRGVMWQAYFVDTKGNVKVLGSESTNELAQKMCHSYLTTLLVESDNIIEGLNLNFSRMGRIPGVPAACCILH